MTLFTKTVLLLSIALSVVALATPHAHSARVDHRMISRRREASLNEHTPSNLSSRSSKARLAKRCKTRSSSPPSSTTTSSTSTSPSASVLNVAPEPNPTTSSVAPTTTSTTAAAAVPTTSDCPNYLSGTQSGDGTYYGTGLGSCGITNQDTDYIVAVSHYLYDSYPGATANPNDNPVCGKKIKATYQGNSVTVTVTDRCGACNCTSLDFSPSAFMQLAPESVGRLHDVTWDWVD